MAAGAREFVAQWKSLGADKVAADFKKVGTSTTGVSKGLDQVNDSSVRTKRRLSEMSVTMGNLVKAGAGIAAGRWFGQGIVGAAQMETNLRGLSSVLGDVVATDIAGWVKENGDALNLSQADALSAARSFSTYAQSVQNAGGDSRQFTEDMLTLASELAAFNNVDPSRVIEALTGAMRGEFDSLQTFGVNVDAAAVSAEALKLGLAGSTAELTAQDKLMGTYAAVMEQGGFAMGTTASNADTLAGSMADLRQKAEDLQTSVGSGLIGPLGVLAGLVGDLADAFAKLPAPVRNTAVALGALTIVKKLLGPAFSDFGTSLKNIRTEMKATTGVAGSFKAGMSGLVGLFNPWMLVLGIGITLLTAWKQDQAEAKAATDLFTDGIVAQTGALNERGKQALAQQLADETDALDAVGVSAEEAAAAVGNTKNYDDLIKKLQGVADGHYAIETALNGSQSVQFKQYDQIGQDALHLIDVLGTLNGSYDANKSKARDLSLATDGVNAAAGDTSAALKGLNDQVDSLNTSMDKLIDNYSTLKGDALTVEEATVKHAEAMDGLAKSVKDNGHSLDQYTEAGARNRIALGEVAEAGDAVVQALIKEGASHRDVAAARKQANQDLRQTGIDAGFTKTQMDNFIASIKKTPKQQKVELAVIFKKDKIKDLDKDLIRLGNRKVKIETQMEVPAGTPGPLAKLMRGENLTGLRQVANIDGKINVDEEEKKKLQDLHGNALIKATWPDDDKHKLKNDLDDAANPGGKPRKPHYQAFIEPGAYGRAKAELDKLSADRTATVTVNTVKGTTSGGTSGSSGGAPGAGTQSVAPMAALAGVARTLAAPSAAPYFGPNAAMGLVQGQSGATGGPGQVTQLRPKQIPIQVFLDGVEIATRVEARHAMAAATSVRRSA